jgi:hypothetical protein
MDGDVESYQHRSQQEKRWADREAPVNGTIDD